jgi:hypothetical protein
MVMGGQACVFYGAAEFSRDLDLVLLLEPENLERLGHALTELEGELIAVPMLDAEVLRRGHAVHFRCMAEGLGALRIDLMSRLRGVDEFDALWERRTVMEIEGIEVDVVSLPDLVMAKKTQRDKDWPMVRRIVDRSYVGGGDVSSERVRFWLRELRSAEFLLDAVRRFPTEAAAVDRTPVRAAEFGDVEAVESALLLEEQAERAADRAYWAPLKRELEAMRKARLV